MTGIGILGNGLLWVVLLITLNASVAVAKYGTYGPIVPQRSLARAEKRPVEEALLNFRIEAAVDGTAPKGCGADLKLDRDRGLLDPQLPSANRQRQRNSQNFMTCTEVDSLLPMTR